MTNKGDTIQAALTVLETLGVPKAQQNERSAVCLLALLNLPPHKPWSFAEAPLIGITPIMEWVKNHYGKVYAPNTRETFRRYTIHQFCNAGIVAINPDNPLRPINSPHTVYQIQPAVLELLRTFGDSSWNVALTAYLAAREALLVRYAHERIQQRIPVRIASDHTLSLSAGEHNELLRAIIEEFAPRFAPASHLIYMGDTGNKWAYLDQTLLAHLGLTIYPHGKMPDIILYLETKNWLLIVEAVTSHGPVDSKRHSELVTLFQQSKAGLVFVTAFPSRKMMSRYAAQIAWETEVWMADAPSHLIHFNGERFLGPYQEH